MQSSIFNDHVCGSITVNCNNVLFTFLLHEKTTFLQFKMIINYSSTIARYAAYNFYYSTQ